MSEMPYFRDKRTDAWIDLGRVGVTNQQMRDFLDDRDFIFVSLSAYSLVGGTDNWDSEPGYFTVHNRRTNRYQVDTWGAVKRHAREREAQVERLRITAQSAYDKLRTAAEGKLPVTLSGDEAAVISDLVTMHAKGVQAAR